MKTRVSVLVLLLALTLADRALFLYQEWTKTDFGIRAELYVDSLIIMEVPEADSEGQPYPFHEVGVRPGDRLLAIYDERGEGGEIHSLADFGDRMRAIAPGESCVVVVSRLDPGGAETQLRLEVPAPPRRQNRKISFALNQASQIYIPLLAALAAALMGLAKPRDNLAFLAALMFFAFSGIFSGSTYLHPTPLREISMLFRSLAVGSTVYLVMLFFLLFPVRSPIEVRFPWIKKAALLPVIVFLVFGVARDLSAILSFEVYQRVSAATAGVGMRVLQDRVEFPLMVGMMTLGLVSLAANALTMSSRRERRRLHWLVFGSVFGLIPLVLGALNYFHLSQPRWLPLVALPLVALFPLSFIYGVLRHRVFGIRLILRRGLRYALVSRGFIVVEALAIFAALHFLVTPLLTTEAGIPSSIAPLGTALAALLLALGIRHLNRRVLPRIDRRFFRDVYDARRILVDLGHAARRLVSRPDRLLRVVAGQILQSLHPSQVSIFLAREESSQLFRLHLHRFEPKVQGVETSQELDPKDVLPMESPFPASPGHSDASLLGALRLDSEVIAARRPRRTEAPGSWGRLRLEFGGRLLLPLAAGERLLGFICLGEKLSGEPYSREDEDLLLAVAEQVAVTLDYSRLVVQAAEQDKLKREMEIAEEVQQQLFPQTLPEMRTLSYTGTCRPARGVGGDYFDFLKLDEHRLVITLGDISGKGVSAALLMASLQGALRSHASVRGGDLTGLVADLNRLMCQSTESGRFATLFYGLYDDRTRRLKYVNAGHLPPVLVRPGSDGEIPQVQRLAPTGMVIGVFCESEYTLKEVTLEPGDSLVIFSDGLTEAERGNGDMFDDHRVVSLLRANPHTPESELQDILLSEVAHFVGSAPQADDITTIVARVR